MTINFDYLKQNPKFREFAPACVEAEQSYSPTTTTAAIATRRALEITVKWIYKVEEELKGLENNFNSLMQRAFKGELG